MAKDVVIHIWCDWHMETGARIEGAEYPVTLGGKARTIDLCDPCTKEFITPLAKLLEAHGALLSASAHRTRRPIADVVTVRCLWCTRDYSAESGSGYAAHVKKVHGYASAIEAFGTTCPICGDLDLRMMMTHVKRFHSEFGFTHTVQAVLWAKDHGDPHGVYADTLNRTPSMSP